MCSDSIYGVDLKKSYGFYFLVLITLLMDFISLNKMSACFGEGGKCRDIGFVGAIGMLL